MSETSTKKTYRVLVVEDAATTRLVLKQGLSNVGYQVETACNGYQALLAFEEQIFDLVLMDVNMPIMDGFECCNALRKVPSGSSIPIILLTGRDDHASINQAFDVGASDFITKPINLRLLLQRIRYGLRDAEREKVLIKSQEEQQILIEQLQSTQTQLIQNEKFTSIGVLASGIAHEINNPLAMIKSNICSLESVLKWLLSRFSESELARQLTPEEMTYLKEIELDAIELTEDTKAGIIRIQSIIQSLIAMSEITDNDCLCELEPVIQESVSLCLKAHGFAGTLTTNFNCSDVTVNISKKDLFQVMSTLMTNALEAAGHNAQLIINSFQQQNTCVIEVIDNGPGITEKHLDRIFEPFFTTKPPGKGTGLGLSVAYQIIKQANGRLSASNKAKGGACFTLELPA